ncbi:Hypothetical protein LUCI_0399 [Lucifera butyrica]|uniref:Uncharacterized protein n=1 Tax=Lucifera butyrica TaxID=1351585 RepID=A0A498R4J3_9FIRM|nr:hypothetical protein [Lucifera butyrica]VBB05192.1 Hypothetical protein LUCI_0399 [Lucifera butyrica]
MRNVPLRQFGNRVIYRKLIDLQNHNILFLLIDGSAVFGRIARIDGDTVSVISPCNVNYLALGPDEADNCDMTAPVPVSQVLIDICDIITFVEGPFTPSPRPVTAPLTQSPLPNDIPAGPPIMLSRQYRLIEELEELESQNLALTVLKGWVIGGQLSEVFDRIALFTRASIDSTPLLLSGSLSFFGPAFPSGVLHLAGAFRAWVNLKGLTRVILPRN